MTTNEENMSNALTTLTRTLATKLDMGDGADLIGTLKATAFKGEVSDAQMTALLVVANQYALNPWTKEIYAFPDKNNGISRRMMYSLAAPIGPVPCHRFGRRI